jgi:hypothetical protein
MSQVAEPPTSALHFVPTHELSKPQLEYVQRQRERLAKTVPNIPVPEHYDSWTLLRGDEPLGTFSAVPYQFFGERFVECGLRVWAPSGEVLDAGREWLAWYLQQYDYIFGRVFPTNAPTRKLVQLMGFRLTGYDHDLDGRVLERYVLRRGELVGPRPKDIPSANKNEPFPLGTASR